MRVKRLAILACVAAGLAAVQDAVAYPWPLKPFREPHPIRGNFGDPRTVFRYGVDDGGLDGPGFFGFHFGVDISAEPGTPVYPVASGTVSALRGFKVGVHSSGGRAFEYVHITPAVAPGMYVMQGKTVLGYVLEAAGHLHFTELQRHRPVNPLAPGHLLPYVDRTRPAIRAIEFREGRRPLEPPVVKGGVAVVADAYDMPALPVPGPWHDLPVAPALVYWSVQDDAGRTVVPTRTAADFRGALPPNSRFWDVYARGTYQNMPAIGPTYYAGMPGRYEFLLTRDLLRVRALSPGAYVLTVTAVDMRGNRAFAAARFIVA